MLPDVQLGSTDLRVSRLGLGTLAFGRNFGVPIQGSMTMPSASDSSQILQLALDMGIKLIDTARTYGESEALIGKAIGHRRQEYVLASKVMPFPDEPQRVRESVEESLRTLRTDVLDLVQVHCSVTDVMPDPSTTNVLLELKRSGEIRYVGASVYGTAQATAAMESMQFDCLLIAYNVLDRRMEKALLPEAGKAKMGILARSVLMKGALTERVERLPQKLSSLKMAARELDRLAAEEVECLPELAYRYALSEPVIASTLAEVTSLRELEQAIRWTSRGPLSSELLSQIREMPILPAELLTPAFWPPLS